MADLIFCDAASGEPLPFEEDGGYYVRTQYDGTWLARPVRAMEGRIGLWAGESFRDLVWDDALQGYILPRKTKRQQDFAKEVEGTPGLLELFCWSGYKIDPGSRLAPPLFTLPASLSREEYGALLAQLREAAIATKSAIQAPVPVGDQVSGQKATLAESLSCQAEALVELSNVTRAYWPLISAHPARELQRKPALVRNDHPRVHATPAGVMQQAIRPDRTRVTIQTVTEDFDTAENRFLCYVLEQILGKQAVVLAERLRRRSHILKEQLGRPLNLHGLPRRYWDLYRQRHRKQRQRLRNQITQYEGLAQKLEDAARWAKSAVQSSWLQQSSERAGIPKQPSQRLLRSLDYAPIYRSYLQVTHATNVSTVSRVLDMLGRYEERPVRSVDRLYELWLFFQVYQTLVDDFGFQPKGSQPIEALRWKKGRLTLPKDGFQLVLRIEDQGEWIEVCQAELWYEPVVHTPDCGPDKRCFDAHICPLLHCYEKIVSEDWKNTLRPDVLLTVKYDGHEYRFALDAKYRSYDTLCVPESELRSYGVDNTFEHDVLGVAKMKYFDVLNLTAAFIVHTDNRPQYTFFGQEPFHRIPERQAVALERDVLQRLHWQKIIPEAGLNIDQQGSVWPAHCFGAVCATPLRPGNLHRLLKCFLMYHARIINVCWYCRKRLTVENGGAHTQPGRDKDVRELSVEKEQDLVIKIERGQIRGAVYYQCPDCGDFWILQRCYGQKHPLLKLGPDSFHAPSRIQPDNLWVNLCPACGSDLPPKQTSDPAQSM